MPTLRKDRGDAWMARALVNGQQVASRLFPPGKKYGPEWRAAKQWEEEEVQRYLASLEQEPETPTDLERFLAWGNKYLHHAERTLGRSTFVEKTTVMKSFIKFCVGRGVTSLAQVGAPLALEFLSGIEQEKGPGRANCYRKNMLAAWKWGRLFVEGFPQQPEPFAQVPPFPVDRGERYVPPEEDVVRVLRVAEGQDLVMLLTFFFTGARRGEVFRLSWERDINLAEGKIRLIDHKGRDGRERVRWYDMHPELLKALLWWHAARPCKVDNVFMQTHSDASLGLPFTQRIRFMERLCRKAGVKPFGFHAIRHKSAAVVFQAVGLNGAQILMGHSRATTTDIYVRSCGLYSDQGEIMTALGQSSIGQAAGDLLKKFMPHEVRAHEAYCNQTCVTNLVQ